MAKDPRIVPNSKQDIRIYNCYAKMVEEGKLSTNEAWILSIIQSFVNNGRDCYMSNQNFAKKLNLSEDRIRHIIAGLREKKLINPKYGKRSRILAYGADIDGEEDEE